MKRSFRLRVPAEAVSRFDDVSAGDPSGEYRHLQYTYFGVGFVLFRIAVAIIIPNEHP